MFELLLDGRLIGKPDGVINEAVSIKKINNRNIMSVIEDILNIELTLCLDLIFIVFPVKYLKIQLKNIPYYVLIFQLLLQDNYMINRQLCQQIIQMLLLS